MRRLGLLLVLIISLLNSGCEDVDIFMVFSAGKDAVKAVTLSEEEVTSLAVTAAEHSDSQHQVAKISNSYTKRLDKLTSKYLQTENLQYNMKVYLDPTVNAFAMADGTIRIYSGLMDMMNDSELLFVIGHEIGHVQKKHIQKKLRFAYAGRAIRKGAASLQNEVGLIASSQLGGFVEKILNAQFSQQEEREADDFGLLYLKRTSRNEGAAVSALKKLATLGNNHSFLSSHPAPGKRAERLELQLKQQS